MLQKATAQGPRPVKNKLRLSNKTIECFPSLTPYHYGNKALEKQQWITTERPTEHPFYLRSSQGKTMTVGRKTAKTLEKTKASGTCQLQPTIANTKHYPVLTQINIKPHIKSLINFIPMTRYILSNIQQKNNKARQEVRKKMARKNKAAEQNSCMTQILELSDSLK